MNKEMLTKQVEDYKNELKVTAENRDRMVAMANQQEAKIQQLMGAIAALERILKEEVKPDVGNENGDETQS